MTYVKSNNTHYLYILLISMLCISNTIRTELSSLAKNDPYPLFSTLDLGSKYLLTKEQLLYKEPELAEKKKNRLNVSITPFGQNASRGKTIKGLICPVNLGDPIPCPDEADVPLGDLVGRTGMIPLLYGQFPEGITSYPGGPTGYLTQAFNALFTSISTPSTPGNLNTELYIDPAQLFGYFSFPIEYRKRGVRFELDVRLYKDFGMRLQGGVSSIRQVVENTINLTDNDVMFPNETLGISGATVNQVLMKQLDNIATEIGIDLGNVIQTSSEEVRLNFFWRDAIDMNSDIENGWAHFLLIPYCEVAAGFSPSKARNPNQHFAAPFANNGHTSVGITAGMNFDFVQTIEIGGEVGFTHFFKRNFCNYPIPTSQFQTELFPFKADISLQPGNNWYFLARIAAYHFLGNLSMHFEWVVLDHKQDTICLQKDDPAFKPEVLAHTTTFKTKFGNAALNYDIAPNIGLGFLWQIPFSQRNAYRSSTIMVGANFTF